MYTAGRPVYQLGLTKLWLLCGGCGRERYPILTSFWLWLAPAKVLRWSGEAREPMLVNNMSTTGKHVSLEYKHLNICPSNHYEANVHPYTREVRP